MPLRHIVWLYDCSLPPPPPPPPLQRGSPDLYPWRTMQSATRLKSSTNTTPMGRCVRASLLAVRSDGPCLSDISFGYTTASPLAARVAGSRSMAHDASRDALKIIDKRNSYWRCIRASLLAAWKRAVPLRHFIWPYDCLPPCSAGRRISAYGT